MKVFGIGWAKTGTTSLGQGLRHLGYRHQSHRFDLVPHLVSRELQTIFSVVDQYDSFDDWPWILLWRELDEHYPDSRFILTIRDSNAWLQSYRAHLDRIPVITEEQNERRRALYGLPFPDVSDEQLVERFERHNREVRQYFADRNNLLVVDWSKGHGWTELCQFLDKPLPNLPFPRANAARDKSWRMRLRGFLSRFP